MTTARSAGALVDEAFALLGELGLTASVSKVTGMVKTWQVHGQHMTFRDYLENVVFVGNPWPRGYGDPTGKTAVWNVSRGGDGP